LTAEDRHLAEGLALTKDVKDLFFPLGRDLEDFHPARSDHKEAFAVVSFGEDGLPPGISTVHYDLLDFLELVLWKTAEQWNFA
jgi:hypothetical protein